MTWPAYVIDPALLDPAEANVDRHTPSFDIGTRYVRVGGENGLGVLTRLPLSLADFRHPEEDDEFVVTTWHYVNIGHFMGGFQIIYGDDDTVEILSDVNIDWDDPSLGTHRPDVAVIFTNNARRPRSRFDTKVEGVKPYLIIEVTSPSTRVSDLIDKVKDYEKAGVERYIIVDLGRTIEDTGAVRLLGFELQQGRWIPLKPDERGWLDLGRIPLFVGLDGDRARLYRRNGEPLPDIFELHESQLQSQAQLDQEHQARLEAQAQLDREQQARLEAETQAQIAADELEAARRRLAALEARLRALGQDPSQPA